MKATLTQERFASPDWMFERKFDGIRLLAYKDAAGVRLYSRNRLPQSIPAVAAAVATLPPRALILDGEVTWDREGAYHVFDVLWHDGDVRQRSLEDRHALLDNLPFTFPLVRVEPLVDDMPWNRACAEGWEGVIAKRLGSIYESKRSSHWLKMKCESTEDFVVGGFTDPQGSRTGLGALLVGQFKGDDFVFAGKVGTGFDTTLLIDLRRRLDPLEIPTSPFTVAKGLPRLRAHWVEPKIAVRVAFIERTVHGKLRHSRLLDVLT